MLDVAAARDGDPVLGPLELRLQVPEVLVGLQLRVVLGHGEEPPERAAQLALRRLEALHVLGGELIHRELHLRRRGAGVDRRCPEPIIAVLQQRLRNFRELLTEEGQHVDFGVPEHVPVVAGSGQAFGGNRGAQAEAHVVARG